MNLEAIGAAIGRIPSALGIVTFQRNGQDTTMLASWIQQASFEPPMVTVAIKAGRPLLESVEDGAPLTISLLGEDNKDLLSRFAKPSDQGVAGVPSHPSPAGNPILSGALAWLDLRIVTRTRAGDHELCFGEVTDGGVLREGVKPWVHLRKSGLGY